MGTFSFAPGQQLGPYQIQGQLGAGGMGEVYDARDTRDGRSVALKVLNPALASDGERLARFGLEARTLGALTHPNLPRIFEWNPDHRPAYLAMELLVGETLRDRLNRGPMDLADACACMRGVAAGLAAAHAKGIVHRDLKPTNVFLPEAGPVKLLDFGIAKALQPEPEALTGAETPAPTPRTRMGTMVGTVGYMAPEQVRGQAVDARADLFVCGILLYEMVFGTRPFEGDSTVEQLNAILKEEPALLARPPEGTPAALVTVLSRCLAKRPVDRYPSAEAFTAALANLERSPGGGRRGWPPAVRIALGTVALAAAAGLAFWAGRGSAPTAPAFQRMTFRQGIVRSARFTPGGGEVLYSAAWDGEAVRVYSARPGNSESRQLDLPQAELLALSKGGDLALSLSARFIQSWMWKGTLARVPLAGGGPRPLEGDVVAADWTADGEALLVVRHVDGRSRIERFPGGTLYESRGWISHPRVSPSGRALAFLEHPAPGDDEGMVMRLELDASRPVQVGPAWASVQGLAWRGEEIWFTAAEAGVARVLWATSGSTVRKVHQTLGTLTLHDFSPDGRRALLSRDLMHTGIRVRLPGAPGERDLSWLDWSLLQDLSVDGKWVLFSEQGEGGGPAYGIYLRATSGEPAIRLGTGIGPMLSPDGTLVAAITRDKPAQIQLLPTNTGQPRILSTPGLEAIQRLRWMPDGRSLVVQARRAGEGPRLFRLGLTGGRPEPLSPEGVRLYGYPISPDGKRMVAKMGEGQDRILTFGPPATAPIPGHDPEDMVVRWDLDGKALYTVNLRALPCDIYRLDPVTGVRTRSFSIAPEEPAGFTVSNLMLLPDARGYAYAYRRTLSELYVVDGLR